MQDVIRFQELVWDTKPECTEATPDYWFADPHDDEEQHGRSEQAIATGICKRCPIMYECLNHALVNNIQEGIWGGYLPIQREAMLRKRKRAKA